MSAPENVRIGGLTAVEIDAVVDLWNRSVPADGIERGVLEERILLDPRFDPRFFLVARSGDRPAGFLVGVCPPGPLPEADPRAERAWITMFGVDPEFRGRGIGGGLLDEILQRFRERGRRRVNVAAYPYGYHLPGVDAARYPEAMALLESRGFRPRAKALGMEAQLDGYVRPRFALDAEDRLRGEGIEIRPYGSGDLFAFLRFLGEETPPDWLDLGRRDLREIAEGRRSPEAIRVAAAADGRILGFCRHDAERFGPVGVAAPERGRGIGTVLVAAMLERMTRRGLHAAWMLWTGDRAARLYARFGFRVTRRFTIMEREEEKRADAG